MREIRQKRESPGKRRLSHHWLLFGFIGWSVVIPTLLGLAAGIWLDNRWPGAPVSWALMLMFAGLALGCVNVWFWIRKKRNGD